MAEKGRYITFRCPAYLLKKIDDVVAILIEAKKIDPEKGRSQFLRQVIEGACDKILNTPVGQIATETEKKESEIKYGCEIAPLCRDFPFKCRDCAKAIKRGHYFKHKEIKEVDEDEQEAE